MDNQREIRISESSTDKEDLDDVAVMTTNENTDEGIGSQDQEHEDDKSQLLYKDAKITYGQSLFMIMDHMILHHTTYKALESILKIIERHLPTSLDAAYLQSLYHLKKSFSGSTSKEDEVVNIHEYCPRCHKLYKESTSKECPCGTKR